MVVVGVHAVAVPYACHTPASVTKHWDAEV